MDRNDTELESAQIRPIEPKPYQKVGASFDISGWIPEAWLDCGGGNDYRVFLDYIDINGQIFKGTSIHVISFESCVINNIRYLKFWGKGDLDHFNAPFIIQSQGRITLKLSCHKDGVSLYIPVIVRVSGHFFFPNIWKLFRHGKIGKIINQYENDLREYYSALEKLEEKRRSKNCISKEDKYTPIRFMNAVDAMELMGGLMSILEGGYGRRRDYIFKEEDKEEKRLSKKYRKAIAWRGPLLGGIFGRMNGFEFNLYSDDHDSHFHVIHRGRGINARFSFPDLQLINYKQAKSTISSKDAKRIVEYLKKPEIYSKLVEELDKRSSILMNN